MELNIETKALDLSFRMLLTCGCPVTEAEERALFNLLQSSKNQAEIPYHKILEIFSPDAVTPFHRIRDFYVWQAQVHAPDHVISRDLVIRFFASSFHWDQAVARGLEEGYLQVKSVAAWFVSHMLLPARVVRINQAHVTLAYEYPGGAVTLKNLFLPNNLQIRDGEIWAVHFAGMLGRLSFEECETARFMLEENAALRSLRGDVEEIDYLDFERKRDYAAFCRARYEKYYA